MTVIYMSLAIHQNVATSEALVAGVPTPAVHCFSTYIITTDWHQDPVQFAV